MPKINDTGIYQLKNGYWGFRYVIVVNGQRVERRRNVDENGNPQVGPKGSMTVLDPSHMQYLEKTKGAAFENIKNGSKVALVAADVPSHTAVQVLATPHVHEDDEYAKKIVSGTDTPNAFVVVLDIDEIFE